MDKLNRCRLYALYVPIQNGGALVDRFSRPLRDLRISVTDRCNLRCNYCMPREVYGPDHEFLPKEMILSYEEMTRVAVAAATLGVEKIRLTGGEPLLRRDISAFITMLRDSLGDGVELAMTTNGILLPRHSEEMKAAGLDRLTVSLDAIDDDLYQRISDTTETVERVFAGIQCAMEAGLSVKVNCVIRKGVNESQILPLVERFRGTGITLRFIEFMDVGMTNSWNLGEVMSSERVRAIIAALYPLERDSPEHPGQVAERWRYLDGSGHVGFISSVSKPFCGDCCRARLSVDGRLYTCLFSSSGEDLLTPLKSGCDDSTLQEIISELWSGRDDRYSELRSSNDQEVERIEMSYIGG